MSDLPGPEQAHAPSRGARALAVAFIAVVTLTAAALLLRERHMVLQQAEDEVTTLTAILEQNMARSFGGVDIALKGIDALLAAREVPVDDPATRATMRGLLPSLPTVRALFVIGPDGFIVHDTDYPNTPRVSLADRDYFRRLAADPKLQAVLSAPLQSRSGTGWFVASARRIGPPGEFRGVAVAAVQLNSLQQLYEALSLRPGQQISLWERSGQLTARYPVDDLKIGAGYTQLPVFTELAKHSRGVFRATRSEDRGERIVGFRTLEGQPYVVTVSSSVDDALASWRRAAAASGVGVLLLALLTAAGVHLFEQRQARKGEALAHQLAAQRAHSMAQELSAMDGRKNEFLATLAHELRNVLAPLQNSYSVLCHPSIDAVRAQRMREIMERQLAQLRHLVDDLLDISRVSTGKVQLVLRRVNLGEVLVAAAAAGQTGIAQAGHAFVTEIPQSEIWVNADSARLLQVFANLLANAAKYTPPGGEVKFGARVAGDEVLVEVSDNGIGIPLDAQAEIFRMFEQVAAHRERAQGGLGIGLALVQKIVAMHEGRVEVASEGEGRGSTFVVSLPLAQHVDEDATVAEQDNARAA